MKIEIEKYLFIEDRSRYLNKHNNVRKENAYEM